MTQLLRRPYGEECSLVPITPEALCSNVEPGTIFGVGSGAIESLSLEWLQWRFEAYVMTDNNNLVEAHCYSIRKGLGHVLSNHVAVNG